MKFDTVIIGGGLVGLMCGIKLVKNGQRCAIVTSGQSSLYFSSGSFDLLGYITGDEPVCSPLDSISELMEKVPHHPYSKLGALKFETLSKESSSLLRETGLKLKGDAFKNHFRLTPMGMLKPAWLTLEGMATSPLMDQLSWKTAAVCNLSGFLDFSHQMVVDGLRSAGIETDLHIFNVRFLDTLKKNPTEIRSVSIAKLLEEEENLVELANAINNIGKNYDAILLPAIFYIMENKTFDGLKQMVINAQLFMLPTMPPSVPGLETEDILISYFKERGGVVFLGDSVTGGKIKDGKVMQVYTANHGDIPFVADNYVLATGSFFNKGLVATNTSVYEPVFNSDVKYQEDREEWYSNNLFDNHNYFRFGVKTTKDFNVFVGGNVVDNLYAIGSILSDFHPIEEGCGGGVAVLTALDVANHILRM